MLAGTHEHLGAHAVQRQAALAQESYPDKTVTIHVGWAAGGIVDIAAHLLAESLTAQWGQQVVVQNTPGAGGVISVGQAALAPADGYNIVAASSSEITSNRFVQENWVPHYDEDVFPVALLSLNPSVLVVNADASYQRRLTRLLPPPSLRRAISRSRQPASGPPSMGG